ncbi:MAG: septum formation protein Maf [Deltaproteobacteria bacterium]|nr:septum formation protein Maf [Deltaproteobacteria bacterium]
MRSIGVPFRVIPSRIEEIPRPGEAPLRFVRRAAREKGEEVSSRHPDAFVISADTVVVVGGRLLGKPTDRREAHRMLSLLAGREHRVHTAACLVQERRGYMDETCVTTRVRFRPLTGREIAAYTRTGECDDKAGAYAAQGAGNLLIERIAGSFTNVVGLPMTQTLAMLQRARILSVARSGSGWYELAG